MSEIDPLSATPVYRQVSDVIRERILSGEIPPDRPVPSITDIVQQFGVARNTAVKALGVLHDEGLVKTVPGRGTFVIEPDQDK